MSAFISISIVVYYSYGDVDDDDEHKDGNADPAMSAFISMADLFTQDDDKVKMMNGDADC